MSEKQDVCPGEPGAILMRGLFAQRRKLLINLFARTLQTEKVTIGLQHYLPGKEVPGING